MRIRYKGGGIIFVIWLITAVLFLHSQYAIAFDNEFPSVQGIYQKLLQEVRSKGSVRVIVGLQADVPLIQQWIRSPQSLEVRRNSALLAQKKIFNKMPLHRNKPSTVKYKYFPIIAMEVDEADLKALVSDPSIIINEDRAVDPDLFYSVPLIGAQSVIDMGYSGRGQVVVVLDTGIDKKHPFLSGKVVAEACFSGNLCPNGLGEQIGPDAGVNCPDYINGCYHGTHVAGIIAGEGSGFSGVARDAGLISIQVFSRVDGSDCGDDPSPCLRAYDSHILKGLDYLVGLVYGSNINISAVNMSLGSGKYNTTDCHLSSFEFLIEFYMRLAIAELGAKGTVVVASSGNDGFIDGIGWPACISQVVSVGSTTKNDLIAYYSNSYSDLDLLAPGSFIYSSMPGGSYAYLSGTSMAAPHVSGAIAVLKSVNQSETGVSALKNTGKPIFDARNGVTTPRINVNAAAEVIRPLICMDKDEDGYGSPGSVLCPNGIGEDCNDSNASIHPGAIEDYNGIDDDCDGQINETGSITQRVSVDSSGKEGTGDVYYGKHSSSDNGRFVAFASYSNLVPEDTNGVSDVYVYDRQNGLIERVSVNSAGWQYFEESHSPSISGDGRYVAFVNSVGNFGCGQVHVHDRKTGRTQIVSIDSNGNEVAPYSSHPAISSNGRYIVFSSDANNLIQGDNNDKADIFIHDRQNRITERVSLNSNGGEGDGDSYQPAISSDGRFVAYMSYATNLVPGDTNGVLDVFVYDRQTGINKRVSVDSVGTEGNAYSYFPSISSDGRFVAFPSDATNLVPNDINMKADIFVHDLQTGMTERVSVNSNNNEADGDSWGYISISGDGRFVTFSSHATNLIPNDTNGAEDVFVHDRLAGITQHVSVNNYGQQGNRYSTSPCISRDGRVISFYSSASNLVWNDMNGKDDIFARDWNLDNDGDGWNIPDDCDDTTWKINPGRGEICDGKDNNCDGAIDETFPNLGDVCSAGIGACKTEGAMVCFYEFSTVCNAEPGLPTPEVCNGIDDDCDGQIDNGMPLTTYYLDADGDGYGNPAEIAQACMAPAGYVANNTDCDDTNVSINPGVAEIQNKGKDDDCNPATPDKTLTSITITPSTATVTVGQTQQFTVTALYSDGSTQIIGTAISSIAAGSEHTCAVLSDGSVSCWGNNGYGQLGDGTTTSSSVPVSVSGITNAVAATAGSSHACALLSDGTVRCWGYNWGGQLGDGTNIDSSIPVNVAGISNAAAISAGYGHSCALLSDGFVKCWGYNGYGQLGNGTNTSSNIPVVVSGVISSVSITAGGYHTCAVLSDGTVRCWGDNWDGQLGNDKISSSNIPEVVVGINSATSIAGGASHTCTILSNGAVRCWGNNRNGQLGDGVRMFSSNVPVVTSGIVDAIGITGGWGYSCAVLSDGTAKCWGGDWAGQLGDGTSTFSAVPVVVSNVYDATLTVSWRSNDAGVAVIDATGLAKGITPGTTTITAVIGGVTASITLTVEEVLDTTLPTGSILINNNAIWTKTTSVTLMLSCSDGPNGSGCSDMQISNDGIFDTEDVGNIYHKQGMDIECR